MTWTQLSGPLCLWQCFSIILFSFLVQWIQKLRERSSFILGHIITVEEKKWVGGRLGTRARYASRNTPSHCISIGMPIPLSILAAHLHWIRYIAWHLELTFLGICAEEVCSSAVTFWLSIRFHSCNDSENLCTVTDPIFSLIWEIGFSFGTESEMQSRKWTDWYHISNIRER